MINITGFEHIIIGTVIIIIFSIIGLFTRKYVIGKLKALAKNTETELDDQIIEIVKNPIVFGFILIGVYFGISYMNLGSSISYYLGLGVFAAIALLIANSLKKIIDLILIRYLKQLAERTESKIDDQLLHLIQNVVGVFLYAVAIIIVLGQFGIRVDALLASLGIAGLAISLAAKDTLSNIFGGITIMLDGSLKVGDRIQVKDYVGNVIEVGLRSTKIITPENNIVTIPNSIMANSEIINYDNPDFRQRVIMTFSISYSSDVEKAKKIIEKVIKKIDTIDHEKGITIFFDSMGDFSLNIKAVFHLKDWRYGWTTRDLVNKKVFEEFKKAGIEIPFPITHVLLEELKKKRKK
jgi:MscS family membrane protein